MTGIRDIKKAALELGACNKIESINSISDAIKLLMTPQGREFVIKTGFPSLDTWREHPYEVYNTEKVLLDMGKDNYSENEDYIVVGNTTLEASFDKPNILHHIVLMHGAKVIIRANNYAVVTVSSYDSEVIIKDGDGTAIVYVEESKKELIEK